MWKKIFLIILFVLFLSFPVQAATQFYDAPFYMVDSTTMQVSWDAPTTGTTPDGYEIQLHCLETNSDYPPILTSNTTYIFSRPKTAHFYVRVRDYITKFILTCDTGNTATEFRIRVKKKSSGTITSGDPYISIPISGSCPVTINYNLPGALPIPDTDTYYVGFSAYNAGGESTINIVEHFFVVSGSSVRSVSLWHHSYDATAKIYINGQYVRNGGWYFFWRMPPPSDPVIP